ncbi:BMP family lipoprotein [Nocardioides jensenii]|uniref:BMP family lipoprotein n=1 Tax=Nocardioides jensenii TaxID=1843 RepID=UPI0008321F9D|nr:BMP family ABC transporter substrate-binding protein [Nocardioides jensenii]
MKKTARIAVALSIAALALSGCGERPSDDNDTNAQETPSASDSATTPKESHPNFKACMVSDSGGFDDKSFNQTSHDGLVKAKTDYGIKTGEAQSKADADYAPNLENLAKEGCNHISTVGFLLGEATEKAAKKHPKIDYSIVDFGYEKPAKNVKGLGFATDQPAYLAGYLAASQSESQIVGTFGGAKIPTVTIFMDGFVKGVEKYNEDKGADVKVVGWDVAKQDGSFTNDFENQAKGQSLADALIRQGADIVMPVAGPAGLGGLQAVKAAGKKAIWVDTDGCVSAAEYCDVLLSSVMKGMDVAVEDAIKSSIDGTFSNEPYMGTLENGGVALAPYHDFDSSIDQETKDEIDALKAQIISGEITIS